MDRRTNTDAQPYSPELDGIRGLAILGVLCSHGASLSGIFDGTQWHPADIAWKYLTMPLWGGVDLFFALSGFLITGILLRSKSAENYFSAFYARRVLRIFPIYYLVLISSLVAAQLLPCFAALLPHPASWKIAYFLYLQNWPVFWHGAKIMGGAWGLYWSLAVEEQFYFIWPLVIMLFREETVAQICYIGLACALPLRLVLAGSYFGGSFGLAQMTTSRVDALFIGAACAIYMFRHKRPVPMRWIIASASVGAMIMAWIAIYRSPDIVAVGPWMTTFGVTSFALLSGALVAISQYRFKPLQDLLTLRSLRKAGKYSYGMYVYHLFVFWGVRYLGNRIGLWQRLNFAEQILVFSLEVAAVFAIAKLSYDLYESRFLRMKRRFEPKYAIVQ